MSKNTDSAAGGAMPTESRSNKPDPSKMADEIEMIKELVDAAYMAANDLVDFQRGAMRGLLGQTSEKIGKVAEEFTDRARRVRADVKHRRRIGRRGRDDAAEVDEEVDDVRQSKRQLGREDRADHERGAEIGLLEDQ